MTALLEDLPQEELSKIRFGRSRLLKAAGGAVFGVITSRMLAGEPAYAATCGDASPCGPSPKCCCCSGTICTCSGCTPRSGQCQSGGQCWNVCSSGHRIIQCCDWWTAQDEKCVCKKTTQQDC